VGAGGDRDGEAAPGEIEQGPPTTVATMERPEFREWPTARGRALARPRTSVRRTPGRVRDRCAQMRPSPLLSTPRSVISR